MSDDNRSGALSVLFLVVMIDMIGFGIVIPFLTFFIDDLASLEGGTGAVAFSSGMSATTSVVQMLSSGDHMIYTSNVYGGTYRLMESIMNRQSIDTDDADIC